MTGPDDRTETRRGSRDVDRVEDRDDSSAGDRSGEEQARDSGARSDPSQPVTNPYYDVHDDDGGTT